MEVENPEIRINEENSNEVSCFSIPAVEKCELELFRVKNYVLITLRLITTTYYTGLFFHSFHTCDKRPQI